MATNKSSKDTRTRNWTAVVYPESLPEDWRDVLDSYHIEWIESPLHEYDTDATGECKKPHWHLLLLFGGVKSYEQVCEVLAPLNCPAPERVHNSRALVRYMAHLDNPDKHQYDVSQIIAHGGVDLAELLKPSHSERYTMISEMMDYVVTEHIIEFNELMDYARISRYDDWFPLLCDSCTNVMVRYINSKRHSRYENRE